MVDALAFTDLDLFGREIDDPIAELEQDVVHMLFETYGSNPDAPTRGIGLRDALSGRVNPGLAHFVETKLCEDDRISGAAVTITATGDSSFRISIEIVANEEKLGVQLDYDAASGEVRRAA